ncbi:MAG: hypothetical protein Q9195_001387 [Heterodermia aff. obscurata]
MNCPSRTDDDVDRSDWNQNPSSLAADLTTRQDLNGIVNSRTKLDTDCPLADEAENEVDAGHEKDRPPNARSPTASCGDLPDHTPPTKPRKTRTGRIGLFGLRESPPWKLPTWLQRFGQILVKFGQFVGPGFMVAVAYIDPGNYSTDVAAGAATRFKLLFIVLMSNVFAILLQSLAVRLGTVTGLNLAEHCRAHLPRWLNICLYLLGEAAIIATDIAEVLFLRLLDRESVLTLLQVIGSAIALNLLFPIPLVAGCALTLVDVLIILLFYSPNGSMRRLRAFEFFVIGLVLGVVICFCIQLSLIENTAVGEVFKGYLPSSTIVQGEGLYLSCGILGATVMPHSLYLGSGMVQTRLRHFDVKAGTYVPNDVADQDAEKIPYRPSLAAIRACLTYSTVEVALSLFTFALFVNSAILIVSGASLSSIVSAQSADLFGIHDLLSKTIAPAAGTIFALALLLSGTSAGIVCTIAGQMLSEGAFNWTIAPWLRRLLTRSISITPSIIIAAAIGKDGLSAALNATQVALSVVLPFVSAPLIYFTCRSKYMAVDRPEPAADDELEQEVGRVEMKNHWLVSVFAVLVWLVIAIMNTALLVLVGLGKA